MAAGDGPPLSLRPFPVADQKPKNLAEFIGRVNSQPGGFRNLTEEKLREEIKAKEDHDEDANSEDQDMSDAEEGDESPENDPNVSRLEVLKNIDLAGNIALLTLDSMSLLLSKQNPTHASLTLSQQLRDMVGIGTIGADKLNDSNATPAKTKEQETVAMGWTLMEINKTRDAAEEATRFLGKEIEAEGKYWEDIISVKKAGWSICKVPQERHTLGVRFGFSEAAPEYKNNGLGPMRRCDDGSTNLDLGRLGGVSEALVVTYEKGGKIVGRSATRPTSEDDSLSTRVLEARNTIFNQELWHELTRESRSLAAYEVKPEGSRLVCDIDSSTKITMELVPLESCSPTDDTLLENNVAETISMTLHILLSHAHRYNELIRIRPIPPHISRTTRQQPYALLRPILARMMGIKQINESTQYIGGLVKTLKKAGLASSFSLRTPQATATDSASRGPNQLSGSHTLVRNMLQPHEFTIDLTIAPEISLTVRGRSFIFPVAATYYNIILPPTSPLLELCPPYAEGYPDIKALSDYLRATTSRALTRHFLSALNSSSQTSDLIQSYHGTSIRQADKETLDIQFAIEDDESSVGPCLLITSTSVLGGKPASQKWRWSTNSEIGNETQTAEEVVKSVVKQAVS